MNREPNFFEHLRAELSSGRVWLDCAVVLGYAVAAGLCVVGFTLASDWVVDHFNRFYRAWPWAVQHARRWLSAGTTIDGPAPLVAGGAAGIAAAFDAPLAGVVCAIEELSGRFEARSSGLIITAIVLAGLVAVSVFGNASYFGVIRVPRLGWDTLAPGLLVTLVPARQAGCSRGF